MTPEQLKEFIAWLETQGLCIAGPVFNPLLGTSYLNQLHADDIPNVIAAFLEQKAAQ